MLLHVVDVALSGVQGIRDKYGTLVCTPTLLVYFKKGCQGSAGSKVLHMASQFV